MAGLLTQTLLPLRMPELIRKTAEGQVYGTGERFEVSTVWGFGLPIGTAENLRSGFALLVNMGLRATDVLEWGKWDSYGLWIGL